MSGGEATVEDDARTAIVELGRVLSGESIAEAQGRDPSEPQKARSNEIAGLIVKVLAPLRGLTEEQSRRLLALSSLTSSTFVGEGDSFVAGTVDGLDIAARRISDELGVIEQNREPQDMTVKLSGQIARALRGGVRGQLRDILARLDALEAGASASGAYLQHRAAAGRIDTFCGIEIGLSGAGMTGIHVDANGLPIRWTTDALRVTCPDCEGAQLELEGAALDDEPDAGPIALAPTSAGLMEASPVRAAAPSWKTPGLDASAVIDAARAAVEERNWRPARPALAGDRELFRLGEALGLPVAFAPREPAPVVDVAHREAALKAAGELPDDAAERLSTVLGMQLAREPSAAHLEALARLLEQTAQLLRARGDR